MKTLSQKIFLLYIAFIFCSCINTQSGYRAKQFYLLFEQQVNMQIMAGHSSLQDSIDGLYLYKVNFDAVRGGKTYFLGNVIKASDGYAAKRIKIDYEGSDSTTKAYSINDLIEMDSIKIDTLIAIRMD